MGIMIAFSASGILPVYQIVLMRFKMSLILCLMAFVGPNQFGIVFCLIIYNAFLKVISLLMLKLMISPKLKKIKKIFFLIYFDQYVLIKLRSIFVYSYSEK